MKQSHRLLAVILAVVMLVGILPLGIFAADTTNGGQKPIIVIACSDFQNKSCTSNNHTPGVTAVQNILNSMITVGTGAGYSKDDVFGFICCGDYYYTGENNGDPSKNGIAALSGCISDNFGSDVNQVFVQGNHDGKVAGIASTGAHDTEYYGVYVIDEDDYSSYNTTKDSVHTVSSGLASYLKSKADANYSKPVFVAAHVPLHAGPRTLGVAGSYDKTAIYAKELVETLNAYGEKLNIIYLCGHNHSKGHDDFMGGSSYFFTKGDSILVADGSGIQDVDNFTSTELNFTYMNAGYVGYYEEYSDADTTLTMTSFEISGNEVRISRFDTTGIHDLKSAGAHSNYTGENKEKVSEFQTKITPDAKVVASPVAVSGKAPVAKTYTDDSGIVVETTSETATGMTVSLASTEAGYENVVKYVAYDISVDGFAEGDTATVSIPVPADYVAANVRVFHVNSGKLNDMNATVKNGVATFTTTHFSTYIVGEVSYQVEDNAWMEIPGQTHLVDLTELQAGDKFYVYVVKNDTEYFLDDSLKSNKSFNVTTDLATAQLWTVEAVAGEFYLKSTDGNYISFGSNSASISSNTRSAYAYYEGGAWYIAVDGRRTYYLKADDGLNITGSDKRNNNTKWKISKSVTDPSVFVTLVENGQSFKYDLGQYTEAKLRNLLHVLVKESGTEASEYNNYSISGSVSVNTAGDYTLTVKYGTTIIGSVTVQVRARQITSVALSTNEGSVRFGASMRAETGAVLTVTYDDGAAEDIPVTLNMLTGDFSTARAGRYEDLTVSYNGSESLPFSLSVLEPEQFPKSPAEGSVTINKTATGKDFLNTGVAQVELSVRGIPYSTGVDVIIMLDASSSMARVRGGDSEPRSYLFADSFKAMLEDLQASDGDIRVAIADFNGFGSGGAPYSRDSNDQIEGSFTANSIGNVYTLANGYVTGGNNAPVSGTTGTLTAAAFVDVDDINTNALWNWYHTTSSKTTGTPYQSGTNYDYAFWATYQLGTAIKQDNIDKGLDRDLIVVFMTDGAANQYNGYVTNTSSTTSSTRSWSYWLVGSWGDAENYAMSLEESEYTQYAGNGHSYYFGGIGKYAQKNRWNEAIKGAPGTEFTVIDKVNGDAQHLATVDGLGATVYSIGYRLDADGYLTAKVAEELVKEQASSDKYWYIVNSKGDLDTAFDEIKGAIIEAATNAHFDDQMGANYNLQMANFTGKEGTARGIANLGYNPTIEVVTYEVWKLSDYENGTITDINLVGSRKTTTPNVVETVTFYTAADGTITAVSDKLGTGNILGTDGLIIAKNFVYNTKATAQTLTYNGKEITVGGESFYWDLGTVQETEYALRYYVYLEGSMEGERPAGSYPTNDHATLWYTNYAGNYVHQDAPKPAIGWKAATVHFAAYLVNENGQPINAQGDVVGFGDRVIVVPVNLAESVLLNSSQDVELNVLVGQIPRYYTPYDGAAAYTVTILGGTAQGSWSINGTTGTTYVTGYDLTNANAFTNDIFVNSEEYDYTNTTVWFAVKYNVGAIEDVVVVDYGIPVDISVLYNDMFYEEGTLTGISTEENGTFGSTLDMDYGSAKLNGNKITFSVKDMNFTEPQDFYYQVAYKGSNYSGKVTVVPATTIYYEDNFVEFSDGWTNAGEAVTATQAEDRPGTLNMTQIDANNVYGYDGAYSECITYSLGSARWTTVSSEKPNTDGTIKATFTFTGTAFDIISVTDKTTGLIKVDVVGPENYTWYVNTFYGLMAGDTIYTKYEWKYTTSSTWRLVSQETIEATEYDATKTTLPTEPVPDQVYEVYAANVTQVIDPNAKTLYQIPVIKSPEMDYGTYTVTITPMYYASMDTARDGSYDFYLDAIRIYNPANKIPEPYYVQDNEGYPEYHEVRNLLLTDKSFTSDEENVNGIVFIDLKGNVEGTQLSDYQFIGPNNEVYLKPNQAIAFKVDCQEPDLIASIQLGAKAVNTEVSLTVNGKEISLKTSTDMYYDITEYVVFDENKTTSRSVIILNTGSNDAILSITNIKITYTEPLRPLQKAATFMMSRADALRAVETVSAALKPVVPAPVVIYGDFNTDGKINGHDLALLRKFFASYDYSTGTSSFVIKDWNPTARDLAKLRKYLAGYDYDSGASSFVLVPDEQ